MTDAEVAHVIRVVSDKAWEIASNGDAPPAVRLAIEALTDDPEIRASLIKEIQQELSLL